MATKSQYMNNFSVSMQNLTVVLDAKATAPDIEQMGSNIPPVFNERKTVDEAFLYMPVEVAKELAISLIHVVTAGEKRTGLKVNLPADKQGLWLAAVNGMLQYEQEKKAAEAAGEDE